MFKILEIFLRELLILKKEVNYSKAYVIITASNKKGGNEIILRVNCGKNISL